MSLEIINGQLFKEWETGKYDVIAQGCNCFSKQGKGLAVEFKRRFRTDSFKLEYLHNPLYKLGNIDFQWQSHSFDSVSKQVCIVNCYTQYGYGETGKKIGKWYPASLAALSLCLEKIEMVFSPYRILVPLIGGGLGGLDRDLVIKTMEDVFINTDVTLVLKNGK